MRNNELLSIAEALNCSDNRSAAIREIMEAITPILRERIGIAMDESCTEERGSEEWNSIEAELHDNLNEYVRRGVQRGFKRLHTEYNR